MNKRTPKTSRETQVEAKDYVKQNKASLFSIQKTKRVQKKKKTDALRKRVFESEKEKKIVSRFTKKEAKKRAQKAAGQDMVPIATGLIDPWAEEDPSKFKSKWEDKPRMRELDKARNPAVMLPKSGESHNPSQGAYSALVNTLFDKGRSEGASGLSGE